MGEKVELGARLDRGHDEVQAALEATAPAGNVRPLKPVGAQELRAVEIEHVRIGGYRTTEVDELLDRAAWTIEQLRARLETAREESSQPRALAAPPDDGLVARALQSAYAVVERVQAEAAAEAERLITEAGGKELAADRLKDEAQQILDGAHASVAGILEQAKAEAATVRAEAGALTADARAEADKARAAAAGVLEGARGELLQAQQQAADIVARAEVERDRVIASSTADIARARAALESERGELAAEIERLRNQWLGGVGNALSRLDAIREIVGDATVPATEEPTAENVMASEPTTVAPGNSETPVAAGAAAEVAADVSTDVPTDVAAQSPAEVGLQPQQTDVVSDLHLRLADQEDVGATEPHR